MFDPTATGRTSTRASDPTRAAHEKSGARCRRIPGARVVSTDVAIDTATAVRPTRTRTLPPRYSSTIFESPPRGPPLKARAMTRSTVPPSHAHRPAAATRGKASERAPSCNGTTSTPIPSSSGRTTASTSPTRYAAKSWLRSSTSRNVPSPSTRSIPRITATVPTASTPSSDPPTSSLPIVLWSLVVNTPTVATESPRSADVASPTTGLSKVGSSVLIGGAVG